MSEPSDADVRRVLARYSLSSAHAEPLGNHGGFSGARIWRVRTDRGDFALKRWPGMDPIRHVEIGRLVREATLPFIATILPTVGGKPHVQSDGHLWDLSAWMPGIADFHSNPSPKRLRAACVALGRLHRAWERFASPPQPCPAVIRRLIAAGEWIDATIPRLAKGLPGDSLEAWADRAGRVVQRQVWDIRHLLEAWRSLPLPVQPCLCDVWHDHVLFTGDEVVGLIDFGAIKPDNVAADLARLLGSLVGDDAAMYEMGLDEYATVRPLSERERRLVPALDQTGVVLGLANWVRRLFHDGCAVENRAAVAARLSELVLRAERFSY